jgi:integrase
MRKDYVPMLEEAGLPIIRFHDIRHSTATLLFALNNTHPKVVQNLLGHSTVRTTIDIYTHACASMHAEATEALGGFLFQRVKRHVSENV